MRSLIEELISAANAMGEEEHLYTIFEFLRHHQENKAAEEMWFHAQQRLEEVAGRALG